MKDSNFMSEFSIEDEVTNLMCIRIDRVVAEAITAWQDCTVTHSVSRYNRVASGQAGTEARDVPLIVAHPSTASPA